jgi:ring-1,2-phenylacetyl-CoA epoxidase subunit PaaC
MANDPRFDYALHLADNALVLAQRLGAWVGHAPELEEDLGLANLALDLLGQARLCYAYAAEIEGRGRTEDDFAYFRDEDEFRNCLLCEQPNGDFGHTIVRHFYFSAYQQELYTALAAGPDARFAEIAAQGLRETRYHVRFSANWLVRLGDGTAESHARAQAAADALWPYVNELFESAAVDRAASAFAPAPESLRPGFDRTLEATLAEATLRMPSDDWQPRGGKDGRHSEHLSYLLAEMQSVARAHPGAHW